MFIFYFEKRHKTSLVCGVPTVEKIGPEIDRGALTLCKPQTQKAVSRVVRGIGRVGVVSLNTRLLSLVPLFRALEASFIVSRGCCSSAVVQCTYHMVP